MQNKGIYVIVSYCGLYFDGIWAKIDPAYAVRYKNQNDAIPDMKWLNAKPGSGIRWTVRVLPE